MKLPRLFQASNTRGVQAERQALDFLQKQGLQLICQNFYCRFGEIDLIMSDQETLVFIEVRYRKNQDFGGATASITAQKQRKLIKTAKHYLSQLDQEPYCRFDVIAISESATQPQWIQDAFQE
ncbi:YraN family protein [Psychromonas sp. B3M02]|uniref:YraN family protein n=1 Tax=unclassified Psychromonas TaxID=2614957 RepID=UPI000DE8C669|nr:YraN family protein [Psychromonas sp. B3M02]RBW44574.1 YraN family protein [Psychromonas sp. B3M02]